MYIRNSILASQEIKTKSENKKVSSPIDNTTMTIKVAGQEYFVTDRKKQIKSQSVGSLSDLQAVESIESNGLINPNDTALRLLHKNNLESSKQDNLGCDNIDKKDNNRSDTTKSTKRNQLGGGCDTKHIQGNSNNIRRRSGSNKSNSSVKTFQNRNVTNRNSDIKTSSSKEQNYTLSKSKSEGNPFQHRKRGKIIKITERPISSGKSCMILLCGRYFIRFYFASFCI